MVVLDPASGKVELAKAFDTYESSVELDKVIPNIPESSIIIAACQDDCVSNLSQTGKNLFRRMGSQQIDNLGYRQGFSFIGSPGKSTIVHN